ncbi:MAG: hydrolase [Chitinophagaceae bacterium]|jgi:predicted hydrolase (HD superfamily)|nr:hydrolase [Chitinophagaceae bacterium]
MSLQLNRTEFGHPDHHGRVLSREEADTLFYDWVKNPRLQLHMRQVAHLMMCWAKEVQQLSAEVQWRWEMAGLLHDADWDQWPEQHCKKIIEHLEQLQVSPDVLRAIASHGPAHFGVEPVSDMDKMLYAFDELSGLIHAYSLMRPGGYEGMDVKGVIKRLKEKSFAASVSREDIHDACLRAGISLHELIAFIIPRQASVAA